MRSNYPKFVKDDEQQNFDALVKAYKNNQLIPYVGAGFSMSPDDDRGCPSWGGFLQSYCDANESVMKADELALFNTHLKNYDYESALDVLVNVTGKPKFFRQVEQSFAKPTDGNKPDGFEHKFALFHDVFKGPWFTTNLDRFIEDSFAQSNAHLTIIDGYKHADFRDVLNRGDLSGYLFKLHGDAKGRQSLVFQKAQYIEAYNHDESFDLNAVLPQFLKRIYQNYSLLFIGCSLTIDRPLKLLEQLAADEGVKPQFACVLREHFKDDSDNLRRLMHLDITPIYLDDFCDIELVLGYLAKLNSAKYESEAFIDDDFEADVFVGRQNHLKTLIDQIKQAAGNSLPESTLTVIEGKPVLSHIQGHGGIGKTTLAREVLRQCGDLFDAYFEIRIDSMSSIDFAKALAAKVGANQLDINTDEQATSFINHTLNQQRLLILLDNVDEGNVLLKLLPQTYRSCLIVTSRDNELKKLIKLKRKQLNFNAIELEKFSEDEALELFKELLDDEYSAQDEQIYLAIAQKVDFLPIALRLAITTMVFGNQYSADELLKLLNNKSYLTVSEHAKKLDFNDNERSILAVFDLSTPLLTDELKYCLALVAVCEQGPVPEDFLWALQQMTASQSNGFEFDEQSFITQLRKLCRLSWCKRTQVDGHYYYELHQIVREVITAELINNELQALEIEQQFVNTLQLHFIEEPKHFSVLDRWINQTDKGVMCLKERRDKRLIKWASSGLGQFCLNRGFGERFINYCKWLRDVFIDDKQKIAISLGNQALIIENKGLLDEALALHQQEQRICEELDDKAGLGRTYGNQGVIIHKQGKLDEALALYKKQQNICEDLDDKLSLSRAYNNQGIILKDKGEFDEALLLYQKAQKLKEDEGDKRGLSITYGNQGIILKSKGQLDEALILFQKKQKLCEELGSKVGLGNCLWNQGDLFIEKGDHQKGLALLNEAIELHKQCGIPTEEDEQKLKKLTEKYSSNTDN